MCGEAGSLADTFWLMKNAQVFFLFLEDLMIEGLKACPARAATTSW